ncbi:hypothetical protein [Cytobacillus oceanisediminis]|uniref:hypothetical protein n=1 Tax=Cytobacillus oceanisediminis TaxID=665099 RepID=UPI003736E863
MATYTNPSLTAGLKKAQEKYNQPSYTTMGTGITSAKPQTVQGGSVGMTKPQTKPANTLAPLSGGVTDYQMSEIIRKAQAGIALDKPTAEKNAIYDQYTKKAQTPNVPQMPAFDQDAYMKQFQDQINEMYNKQRESQLAQLRSSRDKAVGDINQQKAEAAPKYQQMRNQTDAVNMQNVQRLREVMANAGLTATGENVSANAAMNNERVNSLNQLNLQEQETMNDYNRRITDLMNPDNENALMAQLEAERARSLLDMGMRADEIGYSRGRDSIMDSRYLDEVAYGRGRDAENDRRYYGELDYAKSRDRADDRWRNKEWDYQVGRDKVADERYQNETEWNQQREKMEYAWRKYTYNNMSKSEKAQLDWAKQQYGEDAAWRMFEMEYNGELAKSQSQAELDYYSAMDFLP